MITYVEARIWIKVSETLDETENSRLYNLLVKLSFLTPFCNQENLCEELFFTTIETYKQFKIL